ncbi:ATP-binding cassette domain-containing protein [Shigella flexneri]
MGKIHNYWQQHYGITYYWRDLMPANMNYKQRWITPGSASSLPLLPQGVDTPVGDQAARLSVGQAQRVAVARALLNPCSLLLLDQPAASLDAHSEQRVMEALNAASAPDNVNGHPPVRRSCDWDVIWVMQDGRIIEQGRYAELSVAGGRFATLLAHRQEEI